MSTILPFAYILIRFFIYCFTFVYFFLFLYVALEDGNKIIALTDRNVLSVFGLNDNTTIDLGSHNKLSDV